MIGGYGSGIKRLLPQPLRRVRHSLPPSSSSLISVLFERKTNEHQSHWVHSWLRPSSSPPCACIPPSLVVACPVLCLCVCTCVCVRAYMTCRLPVQYPPMLPCSVVLWLWAVSFHGWWFVALGLVRECTVLFCWLFTKWLSMCVSCDDGVISPLFLSP